MRKLINGLIIIVTIGIVVFCAMLPRIYADVQDSVAEEKIEYEDIKTVSFEKELYLVEKLFLLRDGLCVSVPYDSTGHSEEMILEYVYTHMEFFLSRGIILGDMESFKVKMEPTFFFYSDAKDFSGTFWLVEFVLEDELEKISLWIDDETGSLLAVECETQFELYAEGDISAVLDELYHYYMSSLELQGDTKTIYEFLESNESTNESYDDMESVKTKKYGEERVLNVRDIIHGNLSVYFYAYTNGFYVTVS